MTGLNRRNCFREDTQYAIQFSLICNNFEHPADGQKRIPGRIMNKSDNGLYIEVDRYLKPGQNIRVQLTYQPDSSLDKACYIRDGMVIWCKEIDGPNTSFGAGIKILRKFIQAPVLTSRFR